MMAPVIHTGRVDGSPVRFFRSPHFPAPDLPWPDLPALLMALGLAEGDALHVLHKLQRDWPGLARRIPTAEGFAVAVPFFTARDLAQSLPLPPERFGQFMAEATNAMKAAASHLPSAQARSEWAMAACQFQHPAGGGDNGGGTAA
ncbi:hypothetical protein [Caenispirillum salinarum]|uniref:hypothetical protein n=1 Tax=Caenispirillum salinarum TaxID=859058 RepID=UPI0038516213